MSTYFYVPSDACTTTSDPENKLQISTNKFHDDL